MSLENITQGGETTGDELSNLGGTPEELESSYQFFRKLVKKNIFQMTDVNDQRMLSNWLHRCDEEQDKLLRNGYITLMLVSFQNSGGHFDLFKRPLPSKFKHLTYSAPFLHRLIGDQLLKSMGDEFDDGTKNLNSIQAVVSSDLTSYATKHVTDYITQVFFAQSERTIDTWVLPQHVQFPVHSRSSSRWESAMSTSPKIVQVIPTVIQDTDLEDDDDDEKNQQETRCKGLMGEQIAMGLALKQDFLWYDKSRLDGFLRPMNEVCIDKDTCRHEKNQLELDEKAINMLNRIYPGCVRILISPRLITEVTGIHVDNDNTDHPNLNNHRNTLKIDPNTCDNVSQDNEDPEEERNDRECPDEKNVSHCPPRDVIQSCKEYEDDLTRDASAMCHGPLAKPKKKIACPPPAQKPKDKCEGKQDRPAPAKSAPYGCGAVGNTDKSAQSSCPLHGKACSDPKAAKGPNKTGRLCEGSCNK